MRRKATGVMTEYERGYAAGKADGVREERETIRTLAFERMKLPGDGDAWQDLLYFLDGRDWKDRRAQQQPAPAGGEDEADARARRTRPE